MIKKIILLPIFLILLTNCSSDDNSNNSIDENEETELKIHKFKWTTYFEGIPEYSQEYNFDLNENLTKITSDFGYSEYNYDTQGNLTQIDFFSNSNGIYGSYLFEYNTSNKLIKFINNVATGNDLTTIFTYNGNEITLLEEETEKEGKMIFDSDNKLIENSWTSSPNTIFKEDIVYNGDLVLEVRKHSNSNYQYSATFEYDDKINPLYNKFSLHPLDYFTQELYDIEYDGYDIYFSPNNVIKEIKNNVIEIKLFEYNEDGYPVSASIMKNDVLREEQTFEYY